LPRVALSNIRDNPGSRKPSQRGRGQHGGDYHGNGKKINFYFDKIQLDLINFVLDVENVPVS
jgi:hypothetical protein